MKKLFTLLLVATGMTASAQTEKGNLMVGASLGNINMQFQNGQNYLSISLTPRVGYFVAERFALGAMIGLGGAFQPELTYFNYTLQPFARYYFSASHTAFFAEGFAGLAGYTASGDNIPSFDGRSFAMGVGPGIAHFITPNVGLEALLTANYHSGIDNFSYSRVNLNLSVGLQVYLNTRHTAKANASEE